MNLDTAEATAVDSMLLRCVLYLIGDAAMKTLRSGAISISRVAETERFLCDPTWLYPAVTPEIVARNKNWLDNRFIDAATGKLVLAMQSFIIQTRQRNILVGTGNGNNKRRPDALWQHNLNTPYLRNFAAAGLRPEDIDYVLCTHLHSDQVGWNTMLVDGKWVPTFPNAKYLFCAEDFDRLNRRHQTGSADPTGGSAFADSVLPVMEARQALLIEMDHVIEQNGDDGVWLEGTPGHTAGHVSVHVKDGGFHAVLAGDLLHHPIQLTELDLVPRADADPTEAAFSRRRLLQSYADTQTIILPAHFPDPVAGRIVGWGEQYRFRWLER
jgi:glyoxylase-like metal-dependent hydrolase (beta-lactamase superfamily II)